MSITSYFNRAATFTMAGLISAVPFQNAIAENIDNKIDLSEFENFTVRLNGSINLETATKLNRELKYLDAHNPDNKDITILINSPGGSVDQGFAILDTMKSLKSDVRTVCWAQCASMAAFLVTTGGTPGKRFATPNAAFMYHQPSNNCGGKQTEITICYNDLSSDKRKMVEGIAASSGLPADQVKDAIARDWFVNAYDAASYGLIDGVIAPVQKTPANIRARRIPDEVMNKILRPN